ncbi:MAG: hypothetical protein N3C12_14595 [Candidatus Binatia bacterium]|nr:hypothetical protein [Candidatus Binatia bacterium]
MDPAVRVTRGTIGGKTARELGGYLSGLLLSLVLAVVVPARAAEFCGYAVDDIGGTVTGVDLPAGRFRHRIPVAPSWDFSVGPCVGGERGPLLYCAVQRVFRPAASVRVLGQAGVAVDASAVWVIDVQQARSVVRLPFGATGLALVAGGRWLAAVTLEASVLLYDLDASALHGPVTLPGMARSIASSPGGPRVYATYRAPAGNGLEEYGLAIVDAESARLVATVQLLAAAGPEYPAPYEIVGVGPAELVYLRQRANGVEVVDGARAVHLGSIALPGRALVLGHPPRGVLRVRHPRQRRRHFFAPHVASRRGNFCVPFYTLSADGAHHEP